ncbi:hypothetical protein FisN_6Hh223 [Fistulifera solaris]|uniref:Cytochrome b5 heme-binding domain-containing protein n=1 Tax=Fistulifera solaris TaxID=1519565 RepID=A0A1Z5K295_FISSO|nr:hypothetical protein FisN_6Hh223 [Fistulifera solaris]|eukprot:GAX20272.1 hypothetical protein FisN_6Hh223 [Fistulifera solaris]
MSVGKHIPTLFFFTAALVFALFRCKDMILASNNESTTVPTVPLRVVTPEELATKTAEHGDVLWLSVMGEVFDVSKGREFYAEGGYSVFAGRDGSVPFVTGKFTPEEAEKSIEILEPAQLKALDDWRAFYVKEEKYPQIGWLEGYLYDKEGNPSELLQKVRKIVEEQKLIAKDKEAERQEKIKARKERKEKEKAEKARKQKWQQEQAQKARGGQTDTEL